MSTKKSFKLGIVSVDTRINKNGKFTIKTEEGSEVNKKGVFQFTEKHLDNFAANLRATNSDILADAIANSFDGNTLELDCEWAEVGAPVLDAEGNHLEDADSDDGLMYFKGNKDGEAYWRILDQRIVLGEDAVAYIADMNREVGIRAIEKARERKAKSRISGGGATKGAPQKQIEETEDEDLNP